MTKLTILTLLLFSSCAAMQEQWIASNCNDDSAYSTGVQHAQNGEGHDTASYSICNQADQGSLRKSYSKGFNSVANNPVHLIKDALGANFYTCELSPFVDSYTASSSNLGKARYKVMKKCIAKHDEMHCKDFKCTKN